MRSEIPFDKMPGTRLLPWIISVMVYLVTVVLVVSVIAAQVIRKNQDRMGNAVVAEIKASVLPEADSPQDEFKRYNMTLKKLEEFPGVISVRFLGADSFFSPWFSGATKVETVHNMLSMPILVMEFDPATYPTHGMLASSLAKGIPEVKITSGHPLLQQQLRLGWIVLGSSLVLFLIIMGAAMITIVFATFTGISLHEWIIDILQLIGAPDAYIARRFRNHAFILSLKGGLIGGSFAVVSAGLLFYAARHHGYLQITLPRREICLALGIGPLFMSLMAIVSCRLTVLYALARRN